MNKIYSTLLSYKANLNDEGKTAEQILKREFKISSGLFTELKLGGKITINDIPCRSIDKVRNSDVVSADIEENIISDIPEYDLKPPILFEDAHIVVAVKPAGISMHPCRGDYEKTFAGAIIRHWRKNSENHNFHAVTRLDKDTHGICVIAKNRYSHSVLSLPSGIIEKQYAAIVHGKLTNSGVIDAPIIRDENSIIKRKVDENGKKSVTEFNVVESGINYSLLKIRLLTGRTHQIRVHFSHIGHPLYGDWLYGKGDEERELINRQALSACYIKFSHPVSKEVLCFSIDLPDDMKSLLLKIKK